MPTLQGRGPFSYESLAYNSGNTYALNAGSATAPKTQFDSTNGETLEVFANAVLLEGDGSVANAVDAAAKSPAHGFYVNSLTTPTSITLVSNISTGQTITVRRISNRATPEVDFSPGSVIREQDLDNSTNQTLHVAQEAIDIALQSMVLADDNKWNAQTSSTNRVIKNVADPVSANDAVNKTYLEDTWLTATDKTNSATVAGISAHVTTVAGISANVTAVAGDATDIGVVAGKATEIGLLGTSAMATASTGHLARLGNATVTEDMALLGLAPVIEDMSLLGTADVIEDMALLGLAPVIADMAILATDPIVADMAILGTDNIVADMAILGSTTVTDDMALLAVPAVIDDMALLAIPAVITDMDLLGATGVIADLAAVTATGVIADIETVADNVAGVNSFADRYRVASSAPTGSLDEGDLYYNTTNNNVRYYNGTAWTSVGQTEAQSIVTADNSATAMAIALG